MPLEQVKLRHQSGECKGERIQISFQLFATASSKTSQNGVQMFLDSSSAERELRAMVTMSTSISLNREVSERLCVYRRQALVCLPTKCSLNKFE